MREYVIGCSLSALLYSYYTGSPLLYTQQTIPFRFDCFEPYFCLDKIVDQPEPKEIVTLEQTKKQGLPKRDMWEKLHIMLSLAGKIPYADKIKSLRVSDKLKIITRKTKEVEFDKLVVFDDRDIQGIPQEAASRLEKYRVYDWINVYSGTTHNYDCFDSFGGSVIDRVIFYPTDRVDGNHNMKDIVCVSVMNDEQINDYRFSDTYVRFKVEKLMKEAGIKGARNGRDQKNPERYKYYAIKLESVERQIEKIGMNLQSDDERIIIDSRTPEQIIKDFRGTKPNGYLGKLTECLQSRIST